VAASGSLLMVLHGANILDVLAISRTVAVTMRMIDGVNCSNRTLHFDGYPLPAFRNAVFPDFAEGGLPDVCSLLLIGMHGIIDKDVDKFPGTVVYINGETSAHRISQGHYYLGVPTADISGRASFQFYYASYAFLGSPTPFLVYQTDEQRQNFLLYRSSRCFDHRESAFDAFSTLGEVHAAGKCNGTTENFRQVNFDPDPSTAYEGYRFALAMENTNQAGYVTEKIVHAFIGGAIPIYWGTWDVFNLFNRDAFIYFDPENPNEALDRVKYLESNLTAYMEMRRNPILAPGALHKYFSLADNIEGGALKRRIRSFLGIKDS